MARITITSFRTVTAKQDYRQEQRLSAQISPSMLIITGGQDHRSTSTHQGQILMPPRRRSYTRWSRLQIWAAVMAKSKYRSRLSMRWNSTEQSRLGQRPYLSRNSNLHRIRQEWKEITLENRRKWGTHSWWILIRNGKWMTTSRRWEILSPRYWTRHMNNNSDLT